MDRRLARRVRAESSATLAIIFAGARALAISIRKRAADVVPRVHPCRTGTRRVMERLAALRALLVFTPAVACAWTTQASRRAAARARLAPARQPLEWRRVTDSSATSFVSPAITDVEMPVCAMIPSPDAERAASLAPRRLRTEQPCAHLELAHRLATPAFTPAVDHALPTATPHTVARRACYAHRQAAGPQRARAACVARRVQRARIFAAALACRIPQLRAAARRPVQRARFR